MYLADIPVWFPKHMHGIYAVPAYTYTDEGSSTGAHWVTNMIRKEICESVREVFYRTPEGSVIYAGTYKVTASSTFAVKKTQLHRFGPLVSTSLPAPDVIWRLRHQR